MRSPVCAENAHDRLMVTRRPPLVNLVVRQLGGTWLARRFGMLLKIPPPPRLLLAADQLAQLRRPDRHPLFGTAI